MKSSTKPFVLCLHSVLRPLAFVLCLLSIVLSLPSFAITATKEYVDRRDATLIPKPATTVPAGYVLVKSSASNETAWVENTGGGGISPSAVTNIAESAAVTNAGAVASARAYADDTFLGKTATASNADKLDGKHANEFVWNSGGDMYGSYNYVSTSYPDNRTTVSCFGIDFDDDDGGIKYDIGNHAIKFYTTIFPSVKTSKLVPDGTPVVTSNMLNGVLAAYQTNLVVDVSTADKVLKNDGTTLYWGEGGGGGGTTPQIVTNIVTNVVSQAYIRQKLGVYLYVGPDNGIYVHVE